MFLTSFEQLNLKYWVNYWVYIIQGVVILDTASFLLPDPLWLFSSQNGAGPKTTKVLLLWEIPLELGPDNLVFL